MLDSAFEWTFVVALGALVGATGLFALFPADPAIPQSVSKALTGQPRSNPRS